MNSILTSSKKGPQFREAIVIADPKGSTPRDLDDRIYLCLIPNCGLQGSVNEGVFTRKGGDTICSNGHEHNRWLRDAAV